MDAPEPGALEGDRTSAGRPPVSYCVPVLTSSLLARTSLAVRTALALTIAAVAALSAATAFATQAEAASKKGDLWVMRFDVSYELADDAEWNFDVQEECYRSVGRGQQKIRATVDAGTGDLEVRRVGRSWRAAPSPEEAVFSNIGGDESTGRANYDLSSDKDDQSLPGADCPEPIICPECNSVPPQKVCGQTSGTVKLFPQVEFSGRKAKLRLEDQWDPAFPFSDPDRNIYCPESGAVWRWGDPFPATNNPEGVQAIEIDTNRLLGFTRLSDRQRASCGAISKSPLGGRRIVYKRSLCGKREPSFIKKADYTRSTKTILLRNDEAPKLWNVNQTSTIKVTFRFKEMTTFRAN